MANNMSTINNPHPSLPKATLAGEATQVAWQHQDASLWQTDRQLSADVVVIGTGAGGGVAAELLSQAGFRVMVLEMGAFHQNTDFRQQERWAYPQLYQDGAGRKTQDKGISILQGRSVGGSTTVNWTTSIRTPAPTLAYWQQQFGLTELTTAELTPFFQLAEQRFHIKPWAVPPNANNALLKRGCDALGWQSTVIARNVTTCANLGYCGMGCPLNAKQSTLVTSIPAALNAGAQLFTRLYAERFEWQGDRISALIAHPVDAHYQPDRRITIRLDATHFVLAAGAIHSPALLLRSKVPDPSGRLGAHTYLHPSLISGAIFAQEVHGHTGAPQSIYSDEFVWPTHQGMGFKLEVPPIHPVLMATKLSVDGAAHAALMQQFNHLQVTIALLRDGFHHDAQGGQVMLGAQGQPILDYRCTDYVFAGARQALLAMAELQFAAGATQVLPLHRDGRMQSSWHAAKQHIAELPLHTGAVAMASAHVMGGCNMSASSAQGVVNGFGMHHQLQNLQVVDGSVLPTSLGANPQLTIFALAWRNIQHFIAQQRPA